MSLHITTPHCAEVGVLFTDPAGDTRCETTFYVVDPTDNLFSDYAGFATQVWNAVTGHLVAATTSAVVYNGISVEDQRSIPYAGIVFPQTPTAGTVAAGATAMGSGTAFAIKRTTGSPGRSGRGRWYWPLWSNNQLSAFNLVAAASANAMVTALVAFQAAVEGGTYPCQMALVSKQTGGAPRVNGFAQHITGWSYSDLTLDSQRRRLPGRGA